MVLKKSYKITLIVITLLFLIGIYIEGQLIDYWAREGGKQHKCDENNP